MGDVGREGRLDTVFQLNVKGNGARFLISGTITAIGDGATGMYIIPHKMVNLSLFNIFAQLMMTLKAYLRSQLSLI